MLETLQPEKRTKRKAKKQTKPKESEQPQQESSSQSPSGATQQAPDKSPSEQPSGQPQPTQPAEAEPCSACEAQSETLATLTRLFEIELDEEDLYPGITGLPVGIEILISKAMLPSAGLLGPEDTKSVIDSFPGSGGAYLQRPALLKIQPFFVATSKGEGIAAAAEYAGLHFATCIDSLDHGLSIMRRGVFSGNSRNHHTRGDFVGAGSGAEVFAYNWLVNYDLYWKSVLPISRQAMLSDPRLAKLHRIMTKNPEVPVELWPYTTQISRVILGQLAFEKLPLFPDFTKMIGERFRRQGGGAAGEIDKNIAKRSLLPPLF